MKDELGHLEALSASGLSPPGKVCTKCDTWKQLTAYYNQPNTPDGKKSACILCTLEYQRVYGAHNRRKHKYGLSSTDYERMMSEQSGCCAICGDHMPKPCVDHNHETGETRALLCYRCNTALGKFRDNPALLRGAADYLERHNQPRTRLDPGVTYRKKCRAQRTASRPIYDAPYRKNILAARAHSTTRSRVENGPL